MKGKKELFGILFISNLLVAGLTYWVWDKRVSQWEGTMHSASKLALTINSSCEKFRKMPEWRDDPDGMAFAMHQILMESLERKNGQDFSREDWWSVMQLFRCPPDGDRDIEMERMASFVSTASPELVSAIAVDMGEQPEESIKGRTESYEEELRTLKKNGLSEKVNTWRLILSALIISTILNGLAYFIWSRRAKLTQ